MLHVSDHSRIIQIVLLHCVVRAKSEKSSSRAIISETTRVFYRRNRFIGDVFRFDIPCPSLPESRCGLGIQSYG